MRDGGSRLSGDRWTEAVEEIAECSANSRPEEVDLSLAILPSCKAEERVYSLDCPSVKEKKYKLDDCGCAV